MTDGAHASRSPTNIALYFGFAHEVQLSALRKYRVGMRDTPRTLAWSPHYWRPVRRQGPAVSDLQHRYSQVPNWSTPPYQREVHWRGL